METSTSQAQKRTATDAALESREEVQLPDKGSDKDKQVVLKDSILASNNPPNTEKPAAQSATKKQKTAEDSAPPKRTAEVLTGRNLALVPPGIVAKLSNAQIIGHVRPLSERIMEARFYTIDITNFKAALTDVLTAVLQRCYHDKGKLIKASAAAEIAKVVPLTVDACVTALYAKFRTIHKQYGKYTSRFSTPASYNKDIELPLPIADAISDFGVFETTCASKCHVFVPVFPEGTKFEGRSTEEWCSYKYESCIQIFKDIGIPCRNIDSRLKSGSAWWTYKTQYANGMFSGTMVVPPLHYSDNSATIASMFLRTDKDSTESIPLLKHLEDDEDYGYKFQLVRPGVQVRAFMALIAKPDEDWNTGSTFA